MKFGNIRIIGVAAVVIAACLLFSWVQYDEGTEDERIAENFEGTWSPVYNYTTGGTLIGDIPDSFEVAYADGVIAMSADGMTMFFVPVSECEAFAPAGCNYQLYAEDGMLYLVEIYAESDFSGIAYLAMTRDSSATLPGDSGSIAGYEADVTIRQCNGYEFREHSILGKLTVESDSFKIASGTVTVGNTPMEFKGFVKTDGSRYVIVGYADRGDDCYPFNMVLEDEEVMFSAEGSSPYTYTYAGTSDGFVSDLGDGPLSVESGDETIELSVQVEYGMANILSDTIGIPGAVAWTLGGEIVIFHDWAVLAYDGSGCGLVVGSLVA